MTVVVPTSAERSSSRNPSLKRNLFMCTMLFQGALEEILSVCTNVLEKGSVVPLDNERRTALTKLGLSLNDEVSARLHIFVWSSPAWSLIPAHVLSDQQETISASLV